MSCQTNSSFKVMKQGVFTKLQHITGVVHICKIPIYLQFSLKVRICLWFETWEFVFSFHDLDSALHNAHEIVYTPH